MGLCGGHGAVVDAESVAGPSVNMSVMLRVRGCLCLFSLSCWAEVSVAGSWPGSAWQ